MMKERENEEKERKKNEREREKGRFLLIITNELDLKYLVRGFTWENRQIDIFAQKNMIIYDIIKSIKEKSEKEFFFLENK